MITINDPYALCAYSSLSDNCKLLASRLSLKGTELKKLLQERNQPSYGTKAQMLARLRNFSENHEQWQSYVSL
jgi:hypothetical protein